MKKWFLLPFSLFLFNCASDDSYVVLEEKEDLLSWTQPVNFPNTTYSFDRNELSTSRLELGKKLFYDPRLSQDNTVSCASCHAKKDAFSDRDKMLSVGIDGLTGKRNAPAIQNMAFISEYFYDGASNNLEMVPIVPIHNEVEMRETLPSILDKLRLDTAYKKMFREAYDDEKMTSTSMLKALAQYMAMLVSSNSRYDKYIRDEAGGDLSAVELKGLRLFRQNCASCHTTDLFTDGSFRNNGLPANPAIQDLGREEVTGELEDRYKFKVSTVRNIALTPPYMHDGSIATLEEVLNFYVSGVVDSPTLDDELKSNDGTLGIPLSEDEVDAIISFLHTLTDYEFINDPRF